MFRLINIITVVVTIIYGIAATAEGDPRSEIRREIRQFQQTQWEDIPKDLRSQTASHFHNTFLRYSRLLEAEGNVIEALRTLETAQALETYLVAIGEMIPDASIQVARIRAQLVYENPDTLLVALRSPHLSKATRLAMLEILQNAMIDGQIPSPLWVDDLRQREETPPPEAVKVRIRRIHDDRARLEARLNTADERNRSAIESRYLENLMQESLAWTEAGYAATGYICLINAHNVEERLGLAGSERSVISYNVGRSADVMIQSGDAILAVLASPQLSVKLKMDLIYLFKETIFKDDYVTN